MSLATRGGAAAFEVTTTYTNGQINSIWNLTELEVDRLVSAALASDGEPVTIRVEAAP